MVEPERVLHSVMVIAFERKGIIDENLKIIKAIQNELKLGDEEKFDALEHIKKFRGDGNWSGKRDAVVSVAIDRIEEAIEENQISNPSIINALKKLINVTLDQQKPSNNPLSAFEDKEEMIPVELIEDDDSALENLSEDILVEKSSIETNDQFGELENIEETTKKGRKKKKKENDHLRNVSIPKGIEVDNVNLEQAKFLCSLPKIIGQHPDTKKDIILNSGRFGPYLKCDNKSARLENVEEIFTIGLNRAITLIAEAKPGRISSSLIKDLGEHPEDKKPVRIMKGQYGPYIKYKSLNATIPEEKDPTELTMEEALILIEKRKEYDRNKKKKKK